MWLTLTLLTTTTGHSVVAATSSSSSSSLPSEGSWCDLRSAQTVVLSKNESTGVFGVASDDGNSSGDGNYDDDDDGTPPQQRSLRYGAATEHSFSTRRRGTTSLMSRNTSPSSSTASDHSSDFNAAVTLHNVRECSCFEHVETVYCPMTTNRCVLPDTRDKSNGSHSRNGLPVCVAVADDTQNARVLFFVALMFVILTIATLLSKDQGMSLLDFILSSCLPRYNYRVADRMLQQEPQRARQMIRAQSNRVRGVTLAQQETKRRPLSLLLRTRIFQSRKGTVESGDTSIFGICLRPLFRRSDCSESVDDTVTCAICLSTIGDGERVGKLTCNHVYHVECLKPWLQGGKNVCPMCRRVEIAQPSHDSYGTFQNYRDSYERY